MGNRKGANVVIDSLIQQLVFSRQCHEITCPEYLCGAFMKRPERVISIGVGIEVRKLVEFLSRDHIFSHNLNQQNFQMVVW